MVVRAGSHVGAYEIIGLLGTGGMGEVYRAHDATLGREVALKILPEEWLTDPDRRARLDREARVLAALNHPHIGAIYGVEDAPVDGRQIRALILELVEGPTLADSIAEGSGLGGQGSGRYKSSTTPPSASSAQLNRGLPVAEVLKIALQIAEALDAAHEKGIIHRDLKPANIKITPQGVVKVLDFGLATYQARVGLEATTPVDSPISQVATVLIDGTREGMILGTAGYMSPEQARGQPVDKRTDIWAFGCVLYEMLSGRSPFSRPTTSDSVAAILEHDPDWDALPIFTPPTVRRLLERCLAKDSKQRLRDAGDARFEIEEALRSPAPHASTDPNRASRWTPGRLGLGLALLATAAVAGVVGWMVKPASAPAVAQSIVRLVIVPPPHEPLILDRPAIAISQDGRMVAYVAGRGDSQRIYLREIDQFKETPIPGAEGGFAPFFSPDGQWLGFFADRRLKKVLLSGGQPISIADVADIGVSSSGTASWETPDTIFFTPDVSSGIWRVSASGGAPTPVTTLADNEIVHYWPQLLPGGNALLFSALSSVPDAEVFVQRLDTGERRSLGLRGVGTRYVPTGHLVLGQGGTLMAVPFDLDRLDVNGSPVATLTDVMEGYRLRTTTSSFVPPVSVSSAGTVAYVPATPRARRHDLVSVDRAGLEEPVGASGGVYFQPRVSPDGRRIAVAVRGKDHDDIWLYDLARQTWSRFTSEGNNGFPVWPPDGLKLTYNSDHAGLLRVYTKALDGSGPAERLITSERATYTFPFSWSRDGDLAYVLTVPRGVQDIWVLRSSGDGKPTAVLQTPFAEGAPTFSPDGRWIAYASNETGRNEIYVRPFPGPGEKVTISTGGGNEPFWPSRARELFYRNGSAMMAVEIATSPTLTVGKPQRLFDRPYELSLAFWPNYGVTADGQRFFMIKRIDQGDAPAQINVVTNWFEELKRLVAQTRK
jgi:serine/threonine protein kinase/Tol biopolymer transport system component